MIDPIGGLCLAVAAAAWLGVLVGGTGSSAVAVVAGVAVAGVLVRERRVRVVCAMVVVGAAVGWTQHVADEAVASALDGERSYPALLTGRLATDGSSRPPPGTGWYAVVEPMTRDGIPWSGPQLLLSVDEGQPEAMGTVIETSGRLLPTATTSRGRPLAGSVSARRVEVLSPPAGLAGVAEAIRARVRDVVLSAAPPGGPLLAGFLMGDTSAVDRVVVEDLRRAGLSHFVAVSGSNVALFLVGWWVVTLPLAIHPRIRWAVGIAGLVLFATVTRWEPSVVRASVMAGLLLVTRRWGIVLTGSSILGIAVAASLLVAPRLARDLGFALSVAATLGLLVGSGGGRTAVGRALRATVAAQVAVAPILLGFVGEVPVAAPLANLLASPLVAGATVTGGIAAAIGSPALASMAALGADGVVAVARVAAPLPMLDWFGFAAAIGLLAVWRWVTPVRWAALAVVVVAVGFGQVGSGPGPGPWVAFLDVGQGDAAVVRGPGGETILVDGGPDPVALARALDRYRVDRVDLLVVSHRHADHVTGLTAVLGRVPVGEVWHPAHRDLGSLGPLLDAVDIAGVPRRTPGPGSSAALGSVRLEVLGPLRRYASPNDESLVVRVALGGMSVLFAGDIETFAQADLGMVQSDVLKVPHQGAATSDLDWIRASAGSVSVISVGPNDYGHPSSSVIGALESAASLVCRTDLGGDVVVRAGERGPEVARPCPVVHSPP